MHDRAGWTRGTSGNHVVKGRTYKHLVDFTRPCATCEKPFSIFVTQKIADGHADSHSFGLKNCPAHRRNKPADEGTELETLRMANNVMRDELAGLYVRDKELFAEVQALKARLAAYELGPAMAAAAAQNNKMPWELK